MLLPYRVLDLSDEKGALCGRMLGDLGADVIKIEKPGGDPQRHIGPFYSGVANPEKSLFWFAYNANKRGITLDIESAEGRKIFRDLIGHADVVIESFHPGYMDSLGLGYSALSQINQELIMVSITPFGQTGPYSGYKGSDIVCAAMSGFLHMTGEPDRAPLQVSFPQAYLHAGSEATVATLIALYHRGITGQGQLVDMSIQHSLVSVTGNAIPFWEMNGIILRRVGHLRGGVSLNIKQRQLWRCEDGFVNFWILGGGFGEKSNRALTEWMKEEGEADDFIKNMDWHSFDQSKVEPEVQYHLEAMVAKFFLKYPKDKLYEEAVKRGISLAPVSTPKDIAESPQLRDREFWADVRHDELNVTVRYPGSFARVFSNSPLRIRRRAPLIGEHNEEIYEQEMGLNQEQVSRLKEANII